MSSEDYKNGNYSYASFLVDRNSKYQIKKYADKLKDIVCLLIGCTREQLEDREFKEKELGEEWWYYKGEQTNRLFPYNTPYEANKKLPLIKLTPRLLLQLLGTECGREIIHPNIWVNALFSKYEGKDYIKYNGIKYYCNIEEDFLSKGVENFKLIKPSSNWIITDVRFPDEVKAIQDRGGIVIRLERDEKPVIGQIYTIKDRFGDEVIKDCIAKHDDRGYDDFVYTCSKNLIYRDGDYVIVKEGGHESETALDNHKFTHTITNDGSIQDLVEKVKKLNLV